MKKEVLTRLPECKFSFSTPGFLTFKTTQIKAAFQCQSWAYALEWGECLELLKKEEEFTALQTHAQIEELGDAYKAALIPQKNSFYTFTQLEQERADIPSRTYYKMAQAHEYLHLPEQLPDEQLVLELGSAPGGTAYFWLERKQRVIGVDPGDMDPRLLENTDFRHIKRSVQYLKDIDFTTFEKEKVTLITVDMNLKSYQSVKETLRVCELFPALEILLLTIKTPRTEEVENLGALVRKVEKAGFSSIEFRSLPAHRKETLLIARR